jgi:transposase-like protein
LFFLDGIVMKRSWAGEVRDVSLLVAIGVTTDGYREILGIMEGPKDDKSGWVDIPAPSGRSRPLRCPACRL